MAEPVCSLIAPVIGANAGLSMNVGGTTGIVFLSINIVFQTVNELKTELGRSHSKYNWLQTGYYIQTL